MDERGLWELFFATGLPEAYLAVSQCQREEPAETAFKPNMEQV